MGGKKLKLYCQTILNYGKEDWGVCDLRRYFFRKTYLVGPGPNMMTPGNLTYRASLVLSREIE